MLTRDICTVMTSMYILVPLLRKRCSAYMCTTSSREKLPPSPILKKMRFGFFAKGFGSMVMLVLLCDDKDTTYDDESLFSLDNTIQGLFVTCFSGSKRLLVENNIPCDNWRQQPIVTNCDPSVHRHYRYFSESHLVVFMGSHVTRRKPQGPLSHSRDE